MEILHGDNFRSQSVYWGKSLEESWSFQVSLYFSVLSEFMVITYERGVKNCGFDLVVED